jgi:predicted GNAT family acetyltransferase
MVSTKLKYLCTLEAFQPISSDSVRWLAPRADYYRYEQMLHTRGVEPPSYDTWLQWHAEGYGFAAYVRQGTILSVAAVLRQPEGDWELAGVRTLDAHQGKGYATAVSSFITSYIVNERGRAVCELADSDAAMRHILDKLGYQIVEEPGHPGDTGG